jgi:hypothetical protein
LAQRKILYSRVLPRGPGRHFLSALGRMRHHRLFFLFAGVAFVIAAAVGGVLSVSFGPDRAVLAVSAGSTVGVVTPTIVATLSPTATTTTARVTTTSTLSNTTLSSVLSSVATSTLYTHAIASPARIVIPALKCDAKILSVGIDKNGAMVVPNVRYAGWYKLGPAPGASGPSVLVSHVSYNGTPGPFYDLKNVQPGDTIFVYDEHGGGGTAGPGAGTWALGAFGLALAGGLGWTAVRSARSKS